MKLARLSVLSTAIILASAAQATTQFVDDASLDLHLRNYYKNDSFKDRSVTAPANTEDSHSQWVQAVRLDFNSGFFANWVGVDVGMYHSIKVRGDKNSNNGLLSSSASGDANSFGKTSYALKVNLMDMGVAKYGRMSINTPLLNNTDTRALPQLTDAFYAEADIESLSLYGLVAMKGNMDNESRFDHYGHSETGAESVKIIGGSYDFGNGVSTNLAYGQQSEVAKRYFADLNYSTTVSNVGLDFGAQYGQNSAIGKDEESINSNTNLIDKDTSQHVWGVMAAAHIEKLTVGVAYTAVQKRDLGDYQTGWGMADRSDSAMGDASGYFGYNAAQISNFNRNGQKTWGLNASYNFEGIVDGLSVNASYMNGKVNPAATMNATAPGNWSETEINVGASYVLPMVEGLSAHVLYAHNTMEEQGMVYDNGERADEVNKDVRVMVKYDLAVF